jgi:hypothetical protein
MGGAFDHLFGKRSPARAAGDIVIFVRCGQCGERLRVAVPRLELQPQYDGESETGYLLVKDIVGHGCANLMRVTAEMSESFEITYREMTGGEFITEREFRGDSSTGAT